MKISKTVKHHVSMGHYEFMEFEATAEIEGIDDKDAHAELDLAIQMALAPHIQEAYDATDEPDSYINEFVKKEK